MKYLIVFVAGAIAGAYVFAVYKKSEDAKNMQPTPVINPVQPNETPK